jgi:rfaE bifunctional protein nucleotidyltransferase chain/domain
LSLSSLPQVQALRKDRRLVTTNGVFDVLHAGHVEYLERARNLGDLLVVALNTDASVRRLKGAGRPVNPLEDRAIVVGALRCVDAVVAFDEDTPEQLLTELRPQVHVKGGDYRAEDLPETRIVEANGGQVVVLPFLEGRSATSILQRLESAD